MPPKEEMQWFYSTVRKTHIEVTKDVYCELNSRAHEMHMKTKKIKTDPQFSRHMKIT